MLGVVNSALSCTDKPDMDLTSHEVVAIFKLFLAVIFGGMSFLFWVVNRRDDARRVEIIRELDAAEASGSIDAKELTPLERLRREFSALFGLKGNPGKCSELLADVLNRLFVLGEVSVGCPFEGRDDGTGAIDGVIELDANLYLVEIRWQELPVGAGEIANHVELLRAGEEGSPTRGVFVSLSGFTEQAVDAARAALAAGNLVVLCTVGDLRNVVEGEGHIDAFLHTRIHIASAEKNPYASYC